MPTYADTAVSSFMKAFNATTEVMEAPEKKRREQEMYGLRKRGVELGIKQTEGSLADAEAMRQRRPKVWDQQDQMADLRLADAEWMSQRRPQRAKQEDALHSLNMDLSREQLSAAKEDRSNARQDRLDQKQVQNIDAATGLLESAAAEERVLTDAELNTVETAFSGAGLDVNELIDPNYFEAAKRIEAMADPNNEDVPFNPETMLQDLNMIMGPLIRKGVGTEGKDGNTITDKRIVDAYFDPERRAVAFELEVATQSKDGTTRGTDAAPLTERRSSDDDDPVKFVLLRDIIRHARGRKYLSAAFQDPALRRVLRAEAVKRGGSLDGSTDKKLSAQAEYLQYVTQNVFGGDSRAAFNAINSGKQTDPAEFARKMAEAEVESLKNVMGELPEGETFDSIYKKHYDNIVRMRQGGDVTGDPEPKPKPKPDPDPEPDPDPDPDPNKATGSVDTEEQAKQTIDQLLSGGR